MYTVELDISHEMTEKEVKAFANQNNCFCQLIEEFGPAGGNPVYKFFSTDYKSILNLATDVLWNEELAIESIVEQ